MPPSTRGSACNEHAAVPSTATATGRAGTASSPPACSCSPSCSPRSGARRCWSPYDPLKVDFRARSSRPTRSHWLGTDNLGRDILARVFAAGKVDLQIAVVCVHAAFRVGSIVGAVAGYFGGIVDRVICGIVDILWAFPFYVLVIAIVGTLGPSTGNLYLAFTLVVWISFARIVRGEVLVAREANTSWLPACSASAMPGSSCAMSCPTPSPRRSSMPWRTWC